MVIAKKHAELRAKMPPRAKDFSEKLYRQDRAEMALAELREPLQLTQTALAASLKVSQEAVSRLERRPGLLVSTLRHLIEAIGGELQMRAVLPDGTVKLKNLGESPARARR